jgi:hypothetical protein
MLAVSVMVQTWADAVDQARKGVTYVESDDDDDEVLAPVANNSRGRATKRRRVSLDDDDSDDEFGLDAATQQAMLEDDGTFRLDRITTILVIARS